MDAGEGARYVVFSLDGRRLAFGAGPSVQLRKNDQPPDPASWIMLQEFTSSTSSLESALADLGYSGDGELIAAGFITRKKSCVRNL
jgi:hypothetical protein